MIKKKKTFDFASKQYGFAGSLCVKGLKLVTNVVRMLPPGIKVQSEVVDEIITKLEIMIAKKFLNIKKELNGDKSLKFHMKENRHATYLTLKLLNTLLEKFPDHQHKITVKLLKNLSQQLKKMKNANQHKKMLQMTIKLANRLSDFKKSDLYRYLLDIGRDFKTTCYSNEIKEIVFDNPLIFTVQIMEFFQ